MAKSKREFYELPNIATSSDIINAARHSIKAAGTSRPYTPSENKRSLFTTRPTSSSSSIDLTQLTELNVTPRVLSPIDSPQTQKRKEEQKKKESSNFEAYWRSKITPILAALNMEIENVDILNQVEELSECLLRGGFLTGSVVLPHQYKVKVFQCLINLLDKKDSRLLLKISRLLLCLGVYEKNLISISKLIFKLTRCENNDAIFLEEKTVHSLLNVLNQQKIEENGLAFVYCIGALKVLSANTDNTIGDILVQYGVLQVLERHLVTCNTSNEIKGELKSSLLIQILGAFRNLCDIPATEKLLADTGVCEQLQYTMTHHYNDSEVLLNSCRLLSRMSLFTDMCNIISHNKHILNLLLKVIDNYTNDPQLLIRCAFVLGNITGQHSHAALHLHENGAVIESMLSLCKVYKAKLGDKTTKEKQTITKDVLCKAVRVITNTLQNEKIAVSVTPQLIKMFVSLGQIAAQAKIHEISLNVLCGLNNMSYHNKEGSLFVKHRGILTDFLIRLLAVNNTAITIETLGVLGNLTQYHDVVEKLAGDKHVIEIAATLLDSENSDLVYKACGVLINITKFKEFHDKLPSKIVTQCIDVLCDVGMLDVELSTVTLYLLWNVLYLKEVKRREDETTRLLSLLTDYTDHSYCDIDSWITQFHPVAKKLIVLLDTNSEFMPL